MDRHFNLLLKSLRFMLASIKEPLLIERKVKHWIALVFRRYQLHMVSVKEVAVLIKTISVLFKPEDSSEINNTIGIYKIENVYLHKETGMCLYQPDEGDWPTCIKESGLDEYQEISLRQWELFSAAKLNKDRVLSLHFDKPCIIFHVGINSGTNFFHFVIDHLPRLLLTLESLGEPAVLMSQDTQVSFVEQYLALVEKYFEIDLNKFTKDRNTHVKIFSEIVLIGDISRRLRYSAKQFEKIYFKARMDPQLEKLGIRFEDLAPKKFKDQQNVHHWVHLKTGRVLKQSSGFFEHSVTALESVYRFGKTVIANTPDVIHRDYEFVFVTRNKSSARQRFLENEQEVLEALQPVVPVDFSAFSVAEQIVIANRCRVMIGVTGAGLANAVYMEEGSLVVDITPLGRYLPAVDMVEELCRLRNIRYIRVFAEPLENNRYTSVDIGAVRRALVDDL